MLCIVPQGLQIQLLYTLYTRRNEPNPSTVVFPISSATLLE